MSSPALTLDPKTELFRDDFAANSADLPGAGLAWLDARRRRAMEAFEDSGMPTRRLEAWKYTDLAAALESVLEPATPYRGTGGERDAAHDPFAGINAMRVTLINGFLHFIGGSPLAEEIDVVDLAEISARTPEWVKQHLGARAAEADQTLGAASLALMRGGLAIRVRSGTAKPLLPLHLRCVSAGRGQPLMSHTRILLVLEEGAALDLYESHGGWSEEQVLTNLGFEIVLKRGARLNHVRLQEEPASVLHVASVGADLSKSAYYRALLVTLGARLSRLDMNVRLSEPGAEAIIHSVTALGEEAHGDITTVLDHASPHTNSRQLFKSVLDGRARAVSQGRVIVRQGAVKADSHQLFKSLLLSPRAEADAKPELEIYADDVQCGHGTAIGALDADALFYLRSRGIPENEARALLVRAFLEDAIGDFAEETVHDALWQRIDTILADMGEVA
jgi:Fe-S cluster assembly protein SufD